MAWVAGWHHFPQELLERPLSARRSRAVLPDATTLTMTWDGRRPWQLRSPAFEVPRARPNVAHERRGRGERRRDIKAWSGSGSPRGLDKEKSKSRAIPKTVQAQYFPCPLSLLPILTNNFAPYRLWLRLSANLRPRSPPPYPRQTYTVPRLQSYLYWLKGSTHTTHDEHHHSHPRRHFRQRPKDCPVRPREAASRH